MKWNELKDTFYFYNHYIILYVNCIQFFKYDIGIKCFGIDLREIFIDSKTLIDSDLRAPNKFHVSINFSGTCRHVNAVGPVARPLSALRKAYSRSLSVGRGLIQTQIY